MHTLVECPADIPRPQGLRMALEGSAVSRTNTPGAAQHKDPHHWVGLRCRLQNRNLFKQGMSRCFLRSHVDAVAGMPENLFMVDNLIEIQVENNIFAARNGRRKIGLVLAGGHYCLPGLCCGWISPGCDDWDGQYQTRNLLHAPYLREHARLGSRKRTAYHA